MDKKNPIEVGQVYGALTVSRFELRGKNNILIAQCACGQEKVFWKKSAVKRQSSCGCGIDRNGLTKQQRRSWNARWQSYKSGALKRKFVWELSLNQFIEIASKNCYYCNKPPKTWDIVQWSPAIQKDSPNANSKHYEIHFSGIDRLNSKLGYTLDNSLPCCTMCNRAKSDMTFTEFKEHIERINTWLSQNHKDQK